MKLKTEFEPIRTWARKKGIIIKGNAKTQVLKLVEEVGELSASVIRIDNEKAKDAIGDCAIVLTTVAHHLGFTIEECINSAYQEIVNRTGKMVDGNFIKSQE